MKTTALPIDPGPAAWNTILPPAPRYPALRRDLAVNWLIVGAGFAGLSAARRLRQLVPQDSIAVVDATRVAEGPAGRNSGFMIDLPHDLTSDGYAGAIEKDRATTAQNRAAIAFAAEAARAYDMPPEALSLSGKINAAASAGGDRHNQEYAAHLAQMGEEHRLLTAAEMQEICGTGYYTSGLFTPGTAMLQPALYIRGLAAGLAVDDVQLFEDTPVLDLSPGWRARTPDATIRADRVILAVNGHVQSFGYFKRRLMHVFTYASMTRALSDAEVDALGGKPVWGVTPADPMGTTVRRVSGIGGHRIVVRNRFTYDPSMTVHPKRLHGIGRGHLRAFKARFPMLGDVTMDYRWGGRLCLSWNDVPAFGELQPGLFSACCQNGLGTVKGTLGGMRVAELATGAHSDALAAFVAQDQPAKLPPWPLAELGAPVYLRWQERKAGAEF